MLVVTLKFGWWWVSRRLGTVSWLSHNWSYSRPALPQSTHLILLVEWVEEQAGKFPFISPYHLDQWIAVTVTPCNKPVIIYSYICVDHGSAWWLYWPQLSSPPQDQNGGVSLTLSTCPSPSSWTSRPAQMWYFHGWNARRPVKPGKHFQNSACTMSTNIPLAKENQWTDPRSRAGKWALTFWRKELQSCCKRHEYGEKWGIGVFQQLPTPLSPSGLSPVDCKLRKVRWTAQILNI